MVDCKNEDAVLMQIMKPFLHPPLVYTEQAGWMLCCVTK